MNDTQSPSDNIWEAKNNLVAPISKKEKITKEYIKTQNATNT